MADEVCVWVVLGNVNVPHGEVTVTAVKSVDNRGVAVYHVRQIPLVESANTEGLTRFYSLAALVFCRLLVPGVGTGRHPVSGGIEKTVFDWAACTFEPRALREAPTGLYSYYFVE